MTIDFKNIKFKYIKVNGGAPTVDTQMTDKVFDTTKPQGIYKCFVFPNNYFGGYDYEDVQNLVSIEESNLWDRVNRDTFLGFNEESKEFIVNYNAWLSLKDNDLKTIGELPHPSQAGWNLTTLSTTKVPESKFELNQTDGSKVYLSIKPYTTKQNGFATDVYTSISCVENNKKSILNSTLFPKNDILFAKCSDDDSVILVNDCVPTLTVNAQRNVLSRNNKSYTNFGGVTSSHSNYLYGKKIFSFVGSSSKDTIGTFNNAVNVQNRTSLTDIETVYTDNFEDIISSGESLTLYTSPKQTTISYSYDKSLSKPFNKVYSYTNQRTLMRFTTNKNFENTFVKYSDKTIEGMSCNLISLDSRKAFVYEPSGRSILLNGAKFAFLTIKELQFINSNDIPDGFIFLVRTKDSVLRYKKGDPVKKMSSSGDGVFVEISLSQKFGVDLYVHGTLDKLKSVSIPKDNVINGTGFTDVSADNVAQSKYAYSQMFVTVLRI